MRTFFLLALLALPLVGCSSLKRADLTRFYVLSTAKAPDSASAYAQFNGLLFVAPVELASYLDNPGIVIRHGTNRVEFTEQHQWAQPLGDNLTQTLRDDLGGLLGNEHVHLSSRQRPRGPYIALQVRLDQFELAEGKAAVLSATWQLSDGDTGKAIRTRTTRVEKPVPASDAGFSRQVIALSETVADLGREIAVALQALPVQ